MAWEGELGCRTKAGQLAWRQREQDEGLEDGGEGAERCRGLTIIFCPRKVVLAENKKTAPCILVS